MANHQINITENGTKTLLTAQKYCDRNIEINVDVPSSGVEPPQFTNLLDLDTTIIKEGYRVTSTGYIETPEAVAITIPCPYGVHKVRMRGKYVSGFLSRAGSVSPYYVNIYQSQVPPTESGYKGTHIGNDTVESKSVGQDEYGDFYITFDMKVVDGYISFNLKDVSAIYINAIFIEPILTLDEPIGVNVSDEKTLHFEGEVTQTVLGPEANVVLIKSDFLAKHRNEPTLWAFVRFDIEPTPYTVVEVLAFNDPNNVMHTTRCQHTKRWDANSAVSLSNMAEPLNGDLAGGTGVGFVQITENGELRVYSKSTSNYAIRPCRFKVTVGY